MNVSQTYQEHVKNVCLDFSGVFLIVICGIIIFDVCFILASNLMFLVVGMLKKNWMLHKEEYEKAVSLESALELAISREKWYTLKKIWFGLSKFDEEREAAVWVDFNRLMLKLVKGSFGENDFYTLHDYRRPPVAYYEGEYGGEDLVSYYSDGKPIPTKALRRDVRDPEDGEGISDDEFFESYLELEMTASLFDVIFDMWMGRVQVCECDAGDCYVLFVPRRSNHRFHSKLCQQRQFMRDQRKD